MSNKLGLEVQDQVELAVETGLSLEEYWDRKNDEGGYTDEEGVFHPYAITPRDLDRLGLTTFSDYTVQNRRLDRFGHRIARPMLRELAPCAAHQQVRMFMLGIGFANDNGVVQEALKCNVQVVAIDVSSKAVRKAKERWPDVVVQHAEIDCLKSEIPENTGLVFGNRFFPVLDREVMERCYKDLGYYIGSHRVPDPRVRRRFPLKAVFTVVLDSENNKPTSWRGHALPHAEFKDAKPMEIPEIHSLIQSGTPHPLELITVGSDTYFHQRWTGLLCHAKA